MGVPYALDTVLAHIATLRPQSASGGALRDQAAADAHVASAHYQD
jgi:hypothetical protein